MMKRTIVVHFSDDRAETIDIHKAVCIDTETTIFSIEKTKNGENRLVFSKKFFSDDFSKVLGFEVIRDDEQFSETIINVDHNKIIPDSELAQMKRMADNNYNNLLHTMNNKALNDTLNSGKN